MDEQGTLFNLTEFYNRETISQAQTRNAIGECAQQFVAEFLHLKNEGIDGRLAVNPDFSFGGIAGEVKSVGVTNRALVYKWRLEKEMSNFGVDEFFYIFANHSCRITVEDGAGIVQYFKENPPILYVCSLGDVAELLLPKKIRKFKIFSKDTNPRIGYNRKGYIDGGWQFGIKEFNFSGCILAESTYCNQPAINRVYYTKNGETLLAKLKLVANTP